MKNLLKCINISLFTAITLWSMNGYGEDAIPSIYNLPINAVSKPKVHLVITIPEHFATKSEYYDAFADNRSAALKFISEDEEFEDWSEIFTILCFKNKGFNADDVTKAIVGSIELKTKKSSIVKREATEEKRFKSSEVVIQYMNEDGRVEMLYMKNYSGPFDCSGVQFTKLLDRWLEREDAEQMSKSMVVAVNLLAKIDYFDRTEEESVVNEKKSMVKIKKEHTIL